jgi:MYXO-CTERM domain-containing protein
MLAVMLTVGLVVVLASLPLTAPAPEPTPIYGGTTSAPGAWPNVMAVLLPDELCTGTLVSDRVVLTAAHCLDGGEPPGLFQVRNADYIYDSGATYTVERYGTHPKYCGNDPTVCKVDVWDFGYLVLSEPVKGVTPARPLVTQEAWDEAMVVEAPVTLVGYGYNEKMLPGIKREVEAPIVKFSPSGLEFQAGGMGLDTCSGDSGGPAFVTLASGETLLAGVTSRGFTECGKGGFYGIPYAALCWLNAETGVDLRGADACEACDCIVTSADPGRCGCVSGESEAPAGPLLLGAVTLLGLFGRRRRRAG